VSKEDVVDLLNAIGHGNADQSDRIKRK
jgi:hypothetical protein